MGRDVLDVLKQASDQEAVSLAGRMLREKSFDCVEDRAQLLIAPVVDEFDRVSCDDAHVVVGARLLSRPEDQVRLPRRLDSPCRAHEALHYVAEIGAHPYSLA